MKELEKRKGPIKVETDEPTFTVFMKIDWNKKLKPKASVEDEKEGLEKQSKDGDSED